MRRDDAQRMDGFTLVELLVALAVGMILLAGVYQFFIAQRQTYGVQDQVNRLQQDARVAEQLVTKALQQTGAFSPTTGSTVSLRGQVVLAASDHYLVVQADDPYRSDDKGIITADEVIAFAVSKPGATATERIGDDPGVTAKTSRTVRVFFDQDTPPDGVDADESVDWEIPLALRGPPYTLYRITPDTSGTATALNLEEIAGQVDNLVFKYYDQNGDEIVPLHPTTGAALPTYYPLGAAERARIRAVEIQITLRTRQPDRRYQATFSPEDNTVATYDASGDPRTGVSFTNDGYRRRTFRTRISPRNLSANSCGRITLVANPAQPRCPASATVTAAVIDQFGDPVAGQDLVFQLDPSSGASFATLPTVTTTSTATTDANGEASITLNYQDLARSIAVSATTEVDCRPTGPERFTLQNAVSVGFVAGDADRLEVTHPTGPVDTYADSACTGSSANSFTFQAVGYDVCGNEASPDTALTFGFSPSVGSVSPASMTQADETFTLTLPDPGTGAFASLTAEVSVDGGSTWTPSTIAVTGSGTTTFSPAYTSPLFGVTLRPWPPAAIYPNSPATWLAPFVPTAPATAFQDCTDLTLTSDPFQLVDCHDNPITDALGAPYALEPVVTGEGAATISGPSGTDYTLEYTLDGCTIPPGSAITDTVSVELRESGTVVDSAGPQSVPVDGCATCAVEVVQNPTMCEQRGTVSIGGCTLAGKTLDIEVTTTTGTAVGSFSPPGTAVVQLISYTFGTSPVLLDVYVTDAQPGDELTVTAYYPNKASAQWSCGQQLTVSTACESVALYSDSSFNTPSQVETGRVTCITSVSELFVEVKDCQSGTLGSSINTLNEVRIDLEADGVVYDREYVDLDPYAADPQYLRSRVTSPLPVLVDDGSNASYDGVLRYPKGANLRLIATYTDPVDGETCVEVVDGLTAPVETCFFNAISSYNGLDLPGALEVRWGDVAVEGVVDLGAATAPSMAKRSTASLSGTTEDRFLDVYVGQDASGGGGYYQTGSGDTASLPTRPFLLTDDLGNYFQNVSHNGIRVLAPELDFDQLKRFALATGSYWYTLTSNSLGCTDGNQVFNPAGAGTTRCLADVIQDPALSLVFVDTFGPPQPSSTGASIDAASTGTLPSFTVGDVFTGADPKIIYIAGSVRFTTAAGSGTSIPVDTPPEYDEHYLDNPLGTGPVWSPSESDLPVDFDETQSTQSLSLPVNLRAGIYLEGEAVFNGSPVIYGALMAERGITYTSGSPQVWYDYRLRGDGISPCTICTTRPLLTCSLGVTPGSVSVEQNLTTGVTVTGLTGGLVASSADPAVATFNTVTTEVLGVGVGTTTISLSDTLQPLCPVGLGVSVTPCVLSPSVSPGTSLNLGETATVVVSQPVTWSVLGSSAISLTNQQAQSTDVVAGQVGTATLRATGGGLGCSDDVSFTVNCALAVSPTATTLQVGGSPVTVTVSGASGALSTSDWTVPSEVQVTAVSSDTFELTGLAATTGSVPVTVADPMDPTCTATVDVTVVDPPCSLSVSSSDTTIGVGGAAATVTASGANGTVTWSWSSPDGATATLSDTTGTTTDVTGTAAGTVTITAEDSLPSGCTATVDITVEPPCTLSVSSTATDVDVGGSPATLTASGANGTVTWTQSSSDGGLVSLSASTGTSVDATGDTQGTVTITAADSATTGCTADTVLTVNPPACLDLTILYPADGETYGAAVGRPTMVWEGYPDDLNGSNIRDQIDHLEFRAYNASGTVIHYQRESIYGYCGFGSNNCPANPGDITGWADGTYTLEVIAFTRSSHPCGVTSTTRTVQITINN